MVLYKDDGSLVMQNLRKLIDGIDDYLEKDRRLNAHHIAMQTIQEYDVMAQTAMEELDALLVNYSEANVKDMINRSVKVQEVLAMLSSLSHYVSYARDYCLSNLPQEHVSTYKRQFEAKVREIEEASKKYQSILVNMSKIIEYNTALLNYRAKKE